MAEQKKNRLAEIFTKDYKYEGIVLLILSIIAIVVGILILPNPGTIMGISVKIMGWILIGLGGVSLLLSIWPYYKPSVYEVKRVDWPTKKTMLEDVISVFIFTIIFVLFFTVVDLGLTELIDWIDSWGISL